MGDDQAFMFEKHRAKPMGSMPCGNYALGPRGLRFLGSQARPDKEAERLCNLKKTGKTVRSFTCNLKTEREPPCITFFIDTATSIVNRYVPTTLAPHISRMLARSQRLKLGAGMMDLKRAKCIAPRTELRCVSFRQLYEFVRSLE